jgi:prefoldin subunit 1
MQIQSTAVNAQRQLQVVKQQSGGKDRERRIVQLTLRELDGMDSNVNVYKGVGKMWVTCAVRKSALVAHCIAQVHASSPPCHGKWSQNTRERADWWHDKSCQEGDTSVVNFMSGYWCIQQGKYLEKQFNDAQGQLRDIVSNMPHNLDL